jgi:carbamoyl-phosphate synthase large subunit
MPTPPVVLVSSAAAKVLLVQSFQAAGARVIAVDTSPMSAALTYADESYLVPRLDADGALEAFLGLCRRARVGLLVPTRDGELPFFATHADAFLAAGTRVLVSSPAALDTCQDKRQFIDACQRLGVPVPHTWPRGEVPGRWPVFVRPSRGAGAAGAVRVPDQRALDCLESHGGDLVVQEFVSSPEYSIDVLSDFDAQPLQAVARRRVQIRAGESSVSRVERRPALEAMSMRLCGAIGVVGHAVVQAFDDERGGPMFIEVNPRFGGASNLSIAAGLDSPARLLALLNGDPSARAARPIRDTLSMLRFSQDVLIEAAQLTYPPVARA